MPDFREERASTITLPEDDYVGGLNGWEKLAALIKVQEGIVALVPDKAPDRAGSIYLSDRAGEDRKPDVGTIVASVEPDLSPGDRVIYAPWAGLWLRPFRVGGYKVADMRFYGMPDGTVNISGIEREPLEDVIPAKVDGRTLTPIRDVVILKRDKAAVKSSLIELPDDSKLRPLKATVVSAGPDARYSGDELKPGTRVVYNPSALMIGLKSLGPIEGWEGDLDDYAITRSQNLFAVIEQ